MKIDQATGAGVILGVGMGSSVDGFLFHMILRWHHMLSNIIPPNTPGGRTHQYALGWPLSRFHWLVTLVGIFMLWNAAKYQVARATRLPSTKSFVGSLTLGLGLLNLTKGVIDHHLLALHNVREVSNPLPWNIGFLIIGGGLIITIGWALMRGRVRRRMASSARRMA
jgi:uncharacterized membrane protein